MALYLYKIMFTFYEYVNNLLNNVCPKNKPITVPIAFPRLPTSRPGTTKLSQPFEDAKALAVAALQVQAQNKHADTIIRKRHHLYCISIFLTLYRLKAYR